MKRKWIAIGVAAALAAAVVVVLVTRDSDDAAPKAEGWTVIQYQMADTNLEPYMMHDINEMGEVGSNENLDIVALVDRAAEYGEDDALDLGAWVGAKMIHVGSGTGEVLEDLGAVDMSDPATLEDFIVKAIKAYPAAHYAVILNDHGASWPGVGSDDSAGGTTLRLDQIKGAITAALAETGVAKLDLLGFDACLMATYEVASAVAPLADRLIASSELEPGHGWDYHFLQVVADDANATADAVGDAILTSYLEDDDTASTLAMIDLTQMSAVDEAMTAFVSALTERTATLAPAVGRTLVSNPGYGKSPDPTQDTYMTDLGALVAAIGIDALDVSDQADAVLRAINDAVVQKVSGPDAPDFSGMSIYFPPTNDYFDGAYNDISENPSGWEVFIDAFYSAGDEIAADGVATFATEDADITFFDDGVGIAAPLAPGSVDNLASSTVNYAVVNDDGSLTFLGEETSAIDVDDAGVENGFFDLTTLTISDGIDSAVAYASIDFNEDGSGLTMDVPMAYYAPEDSGETYQDVLLTLSIAADGTVTGETYYAYDAESGTYGELTADPAGIIVPQVRTIGADGTETWEPTSDVGLYADLPSLQYSFDKLPVGTELYIELVITDFGGNTDVVSAQITVS